MNLRRLNEVGLELFSNYLSDLRLDPKLQPPFWLLTDEKTSLPVSDVIVEKKNFNNRLEAAQFLKNLFEDSDLDRVEKDIELWSWLTLYFFDQVCPEKSKQERKPSKENIRYIPAVDKYQKYYRHLLLGPFLILQAHGDRIKDAMSLLASPVHIINDVVEQIASRQELISSPTVIGAATKLYIDTDSGAYKRGAGGKGDGSPRRLSEVLDQFDLTYDLSGMTANSLLELLPKEFEKFRS